MKNITTVGAKCTANLTINRGRVKNYGNSVYLKNGQAFELELFNPHEVSVLAKIHINGTCISTSGIIIRPGQRVYLERYIDEDRKFLFETYEVDNTSAEVQRAIANNGKIAVFFYTETQANWLSGTIATVSTYPQNGQPNWYSGTPTYAYNDTSILSNQIGCISTTNINAFNSSSTYTASCNFNQMLNDTSCKSFDSGTKLNETGRIEKGDKSSQEVTTASGNFSPIYSDMVEIVLFPESAKPVEITELRTYCFECGTKIKKQSWKFCPNCGTTLA